MTKETEIILEGLKKGDQIGGPYELSKILSEQGIRPGNKLMLKKREGNIFNVETEEGNFSLDRDSASKIIIQN